MEKVINIQQAQKAKGAIKDPIDYLSKNVVLLSLNKDFDLLSANDTFLKVTGIKREELENLNFFQHLCDNLPEYIHDELNYLLKQQKSWNGNFAFPNADGQSSWFHTNIIPSRDEDGNYIGFNLLATIGKSQQSLITEKDTTESWMNAIFNDAEEANILISLDATVIEFNTTAYEFMSWYTHKELRLNESIPHYFGGSFDGYENKEDNSTKELSILQSMVDNDTLSITNADKFKTLTNLEAQNKYYTMLFDRLETNIDTLEAFRICRFSLGYILYTCTILGWK